MQGKEKKVTELVARHSERLAAGKLPAKRHMPSRNEDIGKERTKLDELQAELRKLELKARHIQHLITYGPGSDDEMGDVDVASLVWFVVSYI